MDEISAVPYKTRFARAEHLVVAINRRPLDELLNECNPDMNPAGLVPALSWVEPTRDLEFVRQRSQLPMDGEIVIAPVLVCPDDVDLSCTVVVAEVVGGKETIEWRRIGLDRSASVSQVGTKVQWLKNGSAWSFFREQYVECLAKIANDWANLS